MDVPNVDIAKVIEIYNKLKPLIDLIGGLFHKKPKPVPAPPIVPAEPPTPGAPAPTPIVPIPIHARAVASARLEIQKAEGPDLSTPERRVSPGNLYSDVAGMVKRNEAFAYGTSFWFNLTAYDSDGEPIENQALVDANLEFRTRHELRRNGELVAYFKGEGDDNPVGEGQPVPYHVWSIDGFRMSTASWLQSAGLNARIRIDLEGTWEIVGYVNGVESNRFEFRTS